LTPVRVFVAATSYPRDAADWQGRFIFDQTAALARQGARVALWAPPGELPPGVESALAPEDARWLDALRSRGGIAQALRRNPLAGARAGFGLLRRLRAACRRAGRRPAGADFYLIDWLQNALALPDDGRPALVTVLGSDFGLLRLPGMVAALRRQFRRRPTLLAPNAGWMAPRLHALFGAVARIDPNPFGVDPRWFAVTRAQAPGRWLVVSRVTKKKLGDLVAWGAGLFSRDQPLDLLGPMQEATTLPDWIAHHGATNPGELRARWFPQAAGLLTLSRHDEGRPQVLIEAMAAGLPVIASHLPAHADLIRHGETGWLADDRAAFAAALVEAADPAVAHRVGSAARAFASKEIGTWDECARRYLAQLERLRAA